MAFRLRKSRAGFASRVKNLATHRSKGLTYKISPSTMQTLTCTYVLVDKKWAGWGGGKKLLAFMARVICLNLKVLLWQLVLLSGSMIPKALASSLQMTAARICLHTSPQSTWTVLRPSKKVRKSNSKSRKALKASKLPTSRACNHPCGSTRRTPPRRGFFYLSI